MIKLQEVRARHLKLVCLLSFPTRQRPILISPDTYSLD
jgi:hypothetical protein